MSCLRIAALAIGLALAPTLLAAPPTLTGMNPRGVERGKVVIVVLTGTNLTPHTRLLLPFKATQKLLRDAKPNPVQVRIQLIIDPATPLAIYPVRVLTEEGVSGFFLFSVDAFPNVNEVEDNSSFAKAQKVPFPVIVTGQCAGGDVDYFRFAVKKGQRVVIETEAARLGSGVVPQIRVTDARQRFIAADDSQKIRGDCRVVFVAPEAGEYVVEFSDSRYRGGNPPDYRLKIADYDMVEEVFPLGGRRGATVSFTLSGGSLAKPVQVRRRLEGFDGESRRPLALDGLVKVGMLSPWLAVGDLPERVRVRAGNKDPKVIDVAPPVTINGRLAHAGDSHRYQFPVVPGQRFRLAVEAESLGSYLDGVLLVSDQAGRQLALVDDVPVTAVAAGQPALLSIDPFTDVTVPQGVSMLMIDLRDQRHRGGINFGYRLTINPSVPDFVVHQPVAEVNVPRGGTAVLTVPVTRRGYNGPIQLSVPNLPAGLTMAGGQVPEGALGGVLTLTAAPTAKLPTAVIFLHIEGTARSAGLLMHRRAAQRVVLNPAPDAPHSVLNFHHFVLGLTGVEPFTVRGPAAVAIVKGYPTQIPVTVLRAADQPKLTVEVTGQVAALPVAPPPGPFTVKPAAAVTGTDTVTITLTAATSVPQGRVTDLLIQGKAMVNKTPIVVTGAAVALTVLRPFTVDVPTSALKLAAGQTIILKGRVKRQPIFREPVQLAVGGLPNGVTLASPPRPIAGNQSDFQVELRADPKAAAALANLTLTCSTKIAGLAYVHPIVTIPVQVNKGK